MNFVFALAAAIVIAIGLALLIFLPWPALLVLILALGMWMAFARSGRQAWSLTMIGFTTIPKRMGSSSVVTIGIAGVVGVLVALLAMAEGFQTTLQGTGSDDTAVVVRSGASSEVNSTLSFDSVVQIQQSEGVLKDEQGEPVASPELAVVASLPKKSSGLDANVEIRGVGAKIWALLPNAQMIDGRKFTPGLRELIVGTGARKQFSGLENGATLILNNQEWTVVGSFESGDAHNSEVWADASTVAAVYRRGNTVTSVSVRLASAGAFDQFKTAIKNNPQLKVDAKTTRAYYSEQSSGTADLIRYLGVAIGAIMAIGAIFGALNTMYAAVAVRIHEIATLRAIGFGSLPVVVSVMLEAMLLALLGGAIGGLIAWAIFNNYTVSTLSSSVSQVVFAFKVSPQLLWTGLKWALAIGFVGGVFPALRAARLPVIAALREL